MTTGTIDNLEHLESHRSERRALSRALQYLLEDRHHKRWALSEIRALALTNQVACM